MFFGQTLVREVRTVFLLGFNGASVAINLDKLLKGAQSFGSLIVLVMSGVLTYWAIRKTKAQAIDAETHHAEKPHGRLYSSGCSSDD